MKINRSGFTLIELTTVVSVIVILALVTVVSYNGIQGRNRDTLRKTDIANISKALELYYMDNGRYPIASGTTSTLGTSWYTSGDSSWNTFATAMTGTIDTFPVDPRNSPGSPLTASNYSYAYFTGSYCGKVAGQWYLLLYRMETIPKERFADGTCTSSPLGDNYYTTYGNSYYRVVR